MRSFVVGLILAQVFAPLVLCDIPMERYEQIHKICVGKSSIEEEMIDRARKGDFAQDDKLKLYLQCIMQEEGCFGADGLISEEQTVGAIPAAYLSMFEEPVRSCVREVGPEPNQLEAAFKMCYCVYTKTPDTFFLP